MELRDLFLLDDGVVFLNHGSFGACPRPVFAEYQRWQLELEREPVDFLHRRLDELLDAVGSELGAYLGADPAGLVLLPNATAGVNVVARSLPLREGDEVLASDHEYGACDLTWEFACERAGARYVRQEVPIPCDSEQEVADAVWAGANDQTRVLFLSHITSRTAVRFPVETLCSRAREAGILTVIDGAHAPGQIDVDIASIGADFYAGNCHKWLCAPKGAGFLHAREEHRDRLHPLVVSWGWVPDSSFVKRHRWHGTADPAAYLAVPAAIRFQREHDWADVRRKCHHLLERYLGRLGSPTAAPELYAQMASVELPSCDVTEVERRLREEHAIEVPVFEWNGRPLLRVSVQAYNDEEDLDRLAEALPHIV